MQKRMCEYQEITNSPNGGVEIKVSRDLDFDMIKMWQEIDPKQKYPIKLPCPEPIPQFTP